MRSRCLGAIAGVLLSLAAGSASAPVIEPPPRPYRGLFGGGPPPDPARNRQDLTVSGSVLWGYDDSLVPPYGGLPVVPYPAGTTLFWDAGLRYHIGTEAKWFEVKGRGFMNAFSLEGVGPESGGEQ